MKSRSDFQTDKEYQEYLRVYFAAMAMQGMAASAYWAENFTEAHSALESAMSVSVAAADALISELNKTTV